MELKYIQIAVSGLVALGIVLNLVPLLRKISIIKRLFDSPNDIRKLHHRVTPTLGGVAIFIAFFIGFSLSGYASEMKGYPYFAAAMLLLFFTGMKDDLVGLSPIKKLLIEVSVGLMLILGSGIYIKSFQGVFGIHELPFWGSVIITLFTMIVVVNAYNLIDGVDGLAGGIGLFASVFFGAGFYVAGEPVMATLALITGLSLLGFLYYNFNPASIFMGDTGSLLVGFLLSVLAISYIGLNNTAAYTDAFGYSSAIIPVAFLMIPLYDTIRVFYIRVRNKRSPFDPDNDHIHHELMKLGLGHKGTTLYLNAVAILVSAVGITLGALYVELHILLFSILSMSVLLLPTTGLKRNILSKFGLDISFGSSHFDYIPESIENDRPIIYNPNRKKAKKQKLSKV